MSENAGKTTDTIPRASVAQLLKALGHLAAAEKSTYDGVRRFLQLHSGRRAPATDTALWTVARDVLTEFQRLGYATAGILPRRRSDVGRLRESPCEITDKGKQLAELYASKAGQAYDTLVLAWLNSHPYFRRLIARILEGPLYVPDVTSTSQVGDSRAADAVASHVTANCLDRLAPVGFPAAKAKRFEDATKERVHAIERGLAAPDLDTKKLVDLVQDSLVIPSFLDAEDLPFDGVTFQHMLKTAGEFFTAASTSSHPDFAGRVVFSTCDFIRSPLEGGDVPITAVQHHGYSFARPQFGDALVSAFARVAGLAGGYADAYALRAIVCLELRVQPPVFATCLKELIVAGESANPVVYTELPFTPPPQGEGYVESGGRRIGRLKLKTNRGA